MKRGLRVSASGAVLICALATGQATGAVEFTIGAGAGVAPDYEGSDDCEAVPLWNLRAADLTYTRLIGDAADSPVVDDVGDANRLFGGALINYGFEVPGKDERWRASCRAPR